MLTRFPTLNYLDESPCFPNDRRLAAAFVEGGLDVERAERDTIRKEEEALREKHRQAFDDMVAAARANPPLPHDPMRFRAVPPGMLVCSYAFVIMDCQNPGVWSDSQAVSHRYVRVYVYTPNTFSPSFSPSVCVCQDCGMDVRAGAVDAAQVLANVSGPPSIRVRIPLEC